MGSMDARELKSVEILEVRYNTMDAWVKGDIKT
jgi:hypothetical protein